MSTVAVVVQSLIVAYLVLGEPFYGRWEYRRLVETVNSNPTARTRFYGNIVFLEWMLTFLALLTLLMRGESIATFGLRSPLAASHSVGGVLTGAAVGVALGLGVTTVLGFVSPRFREQMQAQLESVRAMLPATAAERWWYALVSVTAGVCEEVLFRGLLFAYLSALVPGLSPWVVLLISSLIFGMAHLYQGKQGVLSTGLLGAMLGMLYITTGSLIPSIILHALLDIRILALPLNAERR